jgi:hypothetical protein
VTPWMVAATDCILLGLLGIVIMLAVVLARLRRLVEEVHHVGAHVEGILALVAEEEEGV